MAHHHHHHHHHSKDDSDRSLIVAVSINIVLTVFQIVGGIISGSLALIADALHNLSDAASLGIAIFARKISRKPADRSKTFGYKRAEVVAALINLTILVIISLYLLYEAIWRFFDPVSISGWVIVIVAGVALVIDMITALITLRLSKNNMNMKAAFLHNLSDALASLAVIVAGSLIILYQWFWVDTLLTLLLSLFILYQGLAMLPKTIHLLMEGAPEDIDFDAIKISLLSLEGVDDIHHVHVWSLDEETIALEAHVVANIDTFDEMESIKNIIKKKLSDEFNIKHSTLEFEHEMMC
tara:strand:- start:1993 stop:2880 length:888 start_codon:yes stop_codon:yes gene_type:complete